MPETFRNEDRKALATESSKQLAQEPKRKRERCDVAVPGGQCLLYSALKSLSRPTMSIRDNGVRCAKSILATKVRSTLGS